MKFENVYLEDYYSKGSEIDAARSYYQFESDKQQLKNLLKLKYGRIVEKIIPELIFQIEEQGNKVVQFIHKNSGAKVNAIISQDYFRDLKREAKKIGFTTRRVYA